MPPAVFHKNRRDINRSLVEEGLSSRVRARIKLQFLGGTTTAQKGRGCCTSAEFFNFDLDLLSASLRFGQGPSPSGKLKNSPLAPEELKFSSGLLTQSRASTVGETLMLGVQVHHDGHGKYYPIVTLGLWECFRIWKCRSVIVSTRYQFPFAVHFDLLRVKQSYFPWGCQAESEGEVLERELLRELSWLRWFRKADVR